jgi:hypothetical protein
MSTSQQLDADPSIVPSTGILKRIFVVSSAAVWDAMRPWSQSREQAGYQVVPLDVGQLDTLQAQTPSFVLLVGHPLGRGPLSFPAAQHDPPYRFMTSSFHGDHALVHGSLENAPRHAVARLPVRTMDALHHLVGRLSKRGTATVKTVHFVDGDPRWSSPINRACLWLANHSASIPLPPGMHVARTTFNPHAHPVQRAHGPLQKTGELLVYVGHGQPRSVDGLSCQELETEPGHTVVALLACCHSGTLMADPPGLAETWLALPHGPCAIVAATNVSDPRLNPSLACAFVHAAVVERRPLGEAFLRAQQGAWPAIPLWARALQTLAPPAVRRANRGLYNFLGDPTLVLN